MLRSIGFVVLLGMVLFPAGVTAQIVVGVEPWDSEVTVGQSFEMEYWIGGLGNYASQSLGSCDLTMDFDGALVSYDSATVGDMLGDVGAGEALATIAASPADVNVTEISLLTPAQLVALQPSSFVVFRVRFLAEAVGDAYFEPLVTTILDENGEPLNLELGALATVHILERRAIPTLSTVGICALVGVLLLAGVLVLRRNG